MRVSIGSGGANDGVTGENDDVRRDVENVLGGSKGDTLVGSGKANRLDGRDGNDVIEGGRGNRPVVRRPWRWTGWTVAMRCGSRIG